MTEEPLELVEISEELRAFLQTEYDRCMDTTLLDERETAIDRYNGEPYGDEEDGRSQVVARDTAEVVDYMVISILRTIVAGDRVVEFVSQNEQAAHEATETIMHMLMDEQDGYRILHDWLKAGLLEKNAVAMTYFEPQPPKREVLNGVSAMAMMALEQQGLKIIEATPEEENQELPDTEAGEGAYTVAVLREQPPKFCDAAVPNEEFYASPDGRSLDECRLKGRRVRKTVSDLVQQGMSKEDAESLPAFSSATNATALSNARDEDRYTDYYGASKMTWWHEEWARFDANGDGVAELLYIQRSSDYRVFSIAEMDEVEYHPFEDWSPFPMQHRRIGQSLFDKVGDIERIRTVLFRNALDGIYLSNSPATYVHESSIGQNTIDDLLTVRPGRLIRWTGSVMPTERQGAFDPSSGFAMLEQMNGERESRTGITRLNQGLNADALNKTATGTALMQAQGQQVEEYLARNFANALARLFAKKAKLIKHYGKPMVIPMDGKYVQVDPSQWPDDMVARPRVGLGSGRKDQRLIYRQQLAQYQAEAFGQGLSIVSEQNLYNAAKGFVKDANLGEASEFFTDPATVPPRQPQPDPALLKMQAEQQQKQAELQMKFAETQANMKLKLMEIQGKLQLAQGDAQAKAQLEQQKAFVEMQLAERQQQFEAQLAQQQLALQAWQAAQEHNRRNFEAQSKIATFRQGGALNK